MKLASAVNEKELSVVYANGGISLLRLGSNFAGKAGKWSLYVVVVVECVE